ncbi:MAG: prepilin-type N-terminal cleavage/methylation domain-containing protein [Opitutae bacterium]|nr:prepilin-type N-terminal cleavage/methylation domain-containing protein [Opitutae bacterium]
MTTTTLSRVPDATLRACRCGFTLVEVLISSSLAAFVLTGVMTCFLFLGRSGANIQNYNDMEGQARRGLEQFAQDVRQASEITWNSATDVTLTVDAASVRWAYDAASGKLYRRTSTATREMITGITSFTYKAYTIAGVEITSFSSASALTTAGQTTKQLQISLEASRTSTTAARATNLVLSARYVLRNKRVTA